MLKKLNYIFDRKQKMGALLLTMGLTIGAIMELFGVGLITGLVSLITNPAVIHKNRLLSSVYDALGFKSDEQFFTLVVVGLILVYILKNAYLLWINYVQYTFIYDNQLKIS